MLNKPIIADNKSTSATGDDDSIVDPILLTEESPRELELSFISSGSQSTLSADGLEIISNNDESPITSRIQNNEFSSKASRGQVNGAAAVFGVAGLLLAGPIVGIVAASGSAHYAAHKSGKFANFTRRCGAYLDDILSKTKKTDKQDMSENKTKEATSNPKTVHERAAQDGAKTIWDRITDELLKGAEWTERKVTRTS